MKLVSRKINEVSKKTHKIFKLSINASEYTLCVQLSARFCSKPIEILIKIHQNLRKNDKIFLKHTFCDLTW